MLRRAFWASAIYAGLGLAGGLFYRELTRTHPGSPDSQLGLVHTHLLVLGMLIGLLVLVLERLFRLSASRFSRAFEITWHLGVVLTGGMMAVRGTLTTLGADFNDKMFAGISGTGHMLLTAAFILLFAALGSVVLRRADEAAPGPAAAGA